MYHTICEKECFDLHNIDTSKLLYMYSSNQFILNSSFDLGIHNFGSRDGNVLPLLIFLFRFSYDPNANFVLFCF